MASPGAVAFTAFGIDVRWYGILIGIGFALAVFISYRRAPLHRISRDSILDLSCWVIPLSIIGARLYYVIFNWSTYHGSLSEMVNIRAGGLAIHGGLLVGILTAYVFAARKKIPFAELADLFMPSVALAQAIGRWGNFFNSEAHGTPTDLPWAILVDGQMVHPTFLYESCWCFFLFLFLIWMDRRRAFPGQIALLYGMLYSLERFCVEGLRTDSLMIGPFRQAQVLSAVVFLLCLVTYVWMLQKQRRDGEHRDKDCAEDEQGNKK